MRINSSFLKYFCKLNLLYISISLIMKLKYFNLIEINYKITITFKFRKIKI